AGITVVGQDRFDIALIVHRLGRGQVGREEKNDGENAQRFHAVINRRAGRFAVRSQRHKGVGWRGAASSSAAAGTRFARHLLLTPCACLGGPPHNYPSRIPTRFVDQQEGTAGKSRGAVTSLPQRSRPLAAHSRKDPVYFLRSCPGRL